MGAFAIGGRYIHLNNQLQALDDEKRNFAVTGRDGLRNRAAARGLIYGAGGIFHALSSEADLANSFAQECGMLVPENELKWGSIRPSVDTFDFTQADWMAEFAKERGMFFRGHTLVWHTNLPKWFKEVVNRQNAEQILLKHIKTVAGHYAGRIHSWDVVNEAIFLKDGRSDGLRNQPWLQLLGFDYIDIAFRAAAEADPQALLVYNDNGLDYYDTPEAEATKRAVLKLLERLKSMGTPVHALGIQSHLWGHETRINHTKLRNFLSDVASLGLKIMITEMDVVDSKLPLDIVVRDRIVAEVYEDFLSVVLDEPATIAVITWGLSDRYTWRSTTRPRSDGAPVRPLPLDAELKRKLAWNAIARAFDKAPKHQV